MANQRQNALFSWIYDELTSSFTLGDCHLLRHQEAKAPQAGLRLRLVYQELITEALIAEGIAATTKALSIAAIPSAKRSLLHRALPRQGVGAAFGRDPIDTG